MSLVTAEAITKDYQVGAVVVMALRGISFAIELASFVSFVGPSGSGKITLLNLIGCLDKPTTGNLTVADKYRTDKSADLSVKKKGRRQDWCGVTPMKRRRIWN